MYYRTASLILFIMLISGCVTNQAVQTVQVGDDEKSCQEIKSELARLGSKFEDAKEDSGVTGKNVGLALVFWPGIIVNEVRSNKNQDSIDSRVTHLSAIYNSRCLKSNSSQGELKSLSEQLKELKDLNDQGLISNDEYENARKRALKKI